MCAIGIDPANRDYTGVDLLKEPHFEKAVPDDAPLTSRNPLLPPLPPSPFGGDPSDPF